jgi:hypothetical protein
MHMGSYPLSYVMDQLNSERFNFESNFYISKELDVLVHVTFATSSNFYCVF